MSLSALQNSLTRSTFLPTMMAFRGQWVSGTSYLLNDVVQSPADGQLYMLALSSLYSTVDPATQTGVSPWYSFAGSATTGNPMEFQGNYNNATTYRDGDVVIAQTNFQPYVCVVTTSTGAEPSVSPANWKILSTTPSDGIGINVTNTAGVATIDLSSPLEFTLAPQTVSPVGAGLTAFTPAVTLNFSPLQYFDVEVKVLIFNTGGGNPVAGDQIVLQAAASSAPGSYQSEAAWTWTVTQFDLPAAAGNTTFQFRTILRSDSIGVTPTLGVKRVTGGGSAAVFGVTLEQWNVNRIG